MKRIKQAHGGYIVNAEKGETANPNGRPRKMVSAILHALKKEGVENVTSENVKGVIELMLNMKRDEILTYADDNKAPMVVRLVARHLIKAGNNRDVAEWLFSRAFGKMKETIETKNIDNKELEHYTDDELRIALQLKMKQSAVSQSPDK